MGEDETSYETLKASLSEPLMAGPRVERRRSWHPQQKMAIVQASCAPGAGPTEVARRCGISTGLLYTWRKQLLTAATDGFIRCEVVAEPAAVASAAPLALSPSLALPVPDRPAAGTIEVELPAGAKLWPAAKDGSVRLSAAELSMLLEGIDWRNVERSWRPDVAA